tara:strand:- start:212 stop:439 length:228 start_codon:yes stop_codon:yes gene_type:complete
MTEQQKINNYLEVNERVQRMTGLIDRFELSWFQDKMKEHILSPLLEDGFQQDDLELLMRLAIHAALQDTKLVHEE